jgi:PKD repeat protein
MIGCARCTNLNAIFPLCYNARSLLKRGLPMKFKAIFALILLSLFAACNNTDNVVIPPLQKATVASVSPNKLSRGQDTVLTIQGANFTNVVAIYLGDGVTILDYNAVSSTIIEVHTRVNASAQPGTRPVQVTTTAGMSDSNTLLEVIGNRAPVTRIVSTPEKGAPNTVYTFDAVQSVDQDGAIVNYSWDFGDGKKAIGPIVSHKFGKVGDFDVVLTITDDDGATAMGIVPVTVRDGVAPTAKFSVSPQNGDVNTTYTLNASSSTDSDGSIRNYLWDLGNGQTVSGPIVNTQYKNSGTYFITLTITDNNGLQNSLQKSIDVGAFDSEKAAEEIRSVITEFFRRFALLPSEPADWIVVDWSESSVCTGRAHEIHIIEQQQEFITKDHVTITAPIDVTFLSSSKAHAIATAQFDWEQTDGSVHSGSASHDFTMIFEDGRWMVCDFYIF